MTVSLRMQSAFLRLRARGRASTRRLVVFALPSLATLLRFRNGFVFDDVFVIQRSEFIHRLANLPRAFTAHAMVASSLDQAVGRPAMDTYRPISIASFFWDSALSGRAPWSYHLTNLLLHGLVCLLLLEVLDSPLARPRARFDTLPSGLGPRLRVLVACWFGLSPWLAEAHVFINGRSDLLLALFFLCALLAFRKGLDEGRRWGGWLSAACMLLALLSKEIAVVLLPFVAAVPTSARHAWRSRLLASLPLVLSLALYLLLRFHALSGLRSHSDTAQLLLALRNLPLLWVDGMAHTLAPTPYVLRSLRDDYAGASTATLVLCSVLAVGGGLVLLVRLRRSYTQSWALLMSLASLAPAAMISTSLWPGFGRYLYVPALGVSIALGTSIEQLARTRIAGRVLWTACSALLLASGVLLVDATLGFVDEQTVYGRAISNSPDQAWAHGFMGMSLRRDGQCKEAIPHLNVAANLDPDDPRYTIHLGRCLIDIQAYSAAVGVAQRGRTRFRDTRSEAGFLLIEALSLPSSRTVEQRALLERCLSLDRARSDCAALLRALPTSAALAPPKAN